MLLIFSTDKHIFWSLCLTLSLSSSIQAQSLGTVYPTGPNTIVAGRTTTLSCFIIVTGSCVTWKWERSDQPGVSLTSVEQSSKTSNVYTCTSTYTFEPSQNDDNVVVKCIASKSGFTPSFDEWKLAVQVSPTTPVITGPKSVPEGSNSTWICESKNMRPKGTLTWHVKSSADVRDGYSPQPFTNSDNTVNVVSYLSLVLMSGDNGITLSCYIQHSSPPDPNYAELNIDVKYKPRVTVSQTHYTISEDSSVTLNCGVVSQPAASSVGWMKDNATLNRTSGRFSNGNSVASPSLTISNVKHTDKGVYVCVAQNSVGTAESEQVNLIVRYTPKLTISGGPFGADLGQSIDIPCEIDAYPLVDTVRWYKVKNGSRSQINTNSTLYSGGNVNNPGLRIISLDLADSVNYLCQAENSIGTGESNTVLVRVSYAPQPVVLDAQTKTVKEGDSVTVTCSAQAVPSPSYVWYFNSETTAFSNGSTLQINSAGPEHNGVFTCKASNVKGETTGNVTVEVLYKPRITSDKKALEANETQTLTITCNVMANPQITNVIWKRNLQDLDISGGKYVDGTPSSPSLTVSNVTESDAGLYICRVVNSQGIGDSNSVKVSINYSPRNLEIIPSQNVNITEGKSVNLTCRANAVPETSYKWIKAGRDHQQGKDLVISNATRFDSAEYTCVAANMLGSNSITSTVNILYIPKVSVNKKLTEADEGQSVTITCTLQAYPPVSRFVWIKDTVLLNLTDPLGKFSGGNAGSPNLIVNKLVPSDAGKYSCRATNSEGTSESEKVSVLVNYAPKSLKVTPTSVRVNETKTIFVICESSAFPEPKYTWNFNGQLFQEGQNLTIDSATPANKGDFVCEVTNDKGSLSIAVTVDVLYYPRVLINGSKFGTDLGDSLTIPCFIDANPLATAITWIKMEETVPTNLDIINSGGRYSGGNLSDPSLTITTLTVNDLGRYQCKAANQIGTGTSQFITVSVSYAPRNTTTTPATITVTEGSKISIECSTDSSPDATFTWTRDGEKIHEGNIWTLVSAGPVDNAQVTCTATNVKGSEEATANVIVRFKPRSAVTVPTVKAAIGETVTLTCSTNANPAPTNYTWVFAGKALSEKGKFLELSPKNSNDFGEYQCLATNNVGTSDAINIKLVQSGNTTPGVGASTASTLSPILISLIVIVILLIIIIVIALIIYCYKQGMFSKLCKKKDSKGRVAPAGDTAPTAVETPYTEVSKANGTSAPSSTAVSRQDVLFNFNQNNIQNTHKDEKLRIEDDDEKKLHIPNGTGPIISIFEPTLQLSKPHQLPPLGHDPAEQSPERKKRRRRKKHSKQQVIETAEDATSLPNNLPQVDSLTKQPQTYPHVYDTVES